MSKKSEKWNSSPLGVAYRRRWQKEHRDSKAAANRRFSQRYPEKILAHNKLNKAIAAGHNLSLR